MKAEQKKCCHLVNERGVCWTDHQPCGRKATYTTDSGKPLCATHAKCKSWRKANPRQNAESIHHKGEKMRDSKPTPPPLWLDVTLCSASFASGKESENKLK